jgi:threonine dehydrogenase-like Zn-dependent dehydrogenase
MWCKELKINGVHKDGGFAQFFVTEADKVFLVPESLPDRIAILIEPFAVGFHTNMRAGTRPGDSVFVIGAGPIGIVAAMTAKYFGAAQVVMTEIVPARRDMAREFGFLVLDPSEVDVAAEIMKLTGGVGFDRVIEASGSQAGPTSLRRPQKSEAPLCRSAFRRSRDPTIS